MNRKRLVIVYVATIPVGALLAVVGHAVSHGWFLVISAVAVAALVCVGLSWAALGGRETET